MRTPHAAICVCGLAAAVVAASAAAAQGIDPQKAQAWLERSFGIRSERVVEATPDALVVLKTIEARPPSDFHVIAHLENFAPADPLTPPSSEQEYFINCPSRRFHVERIESFSQNGARGAQSTTFGPTTWGKPIPNSTEERIIAGVCGPAAPVQAEQAVAAPQAVQDRKPPPAVAALPIRRPPPIPPPRSAPTPAPQPSPSGPARVQLFAGADRQAAQRFVKSLPARLRASAVGAPQIIEGSAGGRPIYRVQIAGFVTAAEAARFCAAARAVGQDCFVPPGS